MSASKSDPCRGNDLGGHDRMGTWCEGASDGETGNVARRTFPGGHAELWAGSDDSEEGRGLFRCPPLMKFMNRFFSCASNLSCLDLKHSSLTSCKREREREREKEMATTMSIYWHQPLLGQSWGCG